MTGQERISAAASAVVDPRAARAQAECLRYPSPERLSIGLQGKK